VELGGTLRHPRQRQTPRERVRKTH
jgi:hypothetical protein